MTTYTVTNTAGRLSASSDADSIYVQSAAAKGSTILGNAGNDTIRFAEAISDVSAAAPSIHGGAGADSIYVLSAGYSAGGGISVLGGGGADTITIAGSGALASLKAGEDADSVTFVGGATAEYIGMSKGSDTLLISASVDGIGMGNGHDLISGSTVTFLTAGYIKLGDGKDTIQAGELAGESAAYINGDTTDTLGNADLIDLNSTVTALTVRGGVGADTITVSGFDGTALIAGNAGADSIGTVDLAVGLSLKGGAGNDTITVSALEAEAVSILGGADADSIYIQSILDGNAASARIQGGAGADTIRISGTSDETNNLGTFVFSALSESTLGSIDIVDAGDGMSGAGSSAFFDFSNNASAAGAVGTESAAIIFGSTTNRATVASSLVTLSGDTNVSSVTAAAASVDKVVLGAGSVALFTTKGGTEYLFMQGGSTGTDDDAIVRFEGLSAKSIAAGGSAAVVTFSGTDS